jgi:hypothetical protein
MMMSKRKWRTNAESLNSQSDRSLDRRLLPLGRHDWTSVFSLSADMSGSENEMSQPFKSGALVEKQCRQIHTGAPCGQVDTVADSVNSSSLRMLPEF